MELIVVGIVLLTASIHPFRELILKGTAFSEVAYLGVIMVWAVIAIIHAFILGVDLWSGLSVLPLILISTVGLMFYYLILAAYQLVGNVAAVNSLRQISIPLLVIMSCSFLKEANIGVRLAWAIVLAVGIVIIILAR